MSRLQRVENLCAQAYADRQWHKWQQARCILRELYRRRTETEAQRASMLSEIKNVFFNLKNK